MGYVHLDLRVLHIDCTVDAQVATTTQAHSVNRRIAIFQHAAAVGDNALQFLHALVQFGDGTSAVHQLSYTSESPTHFQPILGLANLAAK